MILPIEIYGSPILRKKAVNVDLENINKEELKKFIDSMFETMYASDGVGLAAPQVGESIRIFVVDASEMDKNDPELQNFKKIFINPIILKKYGEHKIFNEGCLSLPGIREDITRPESITIRYYDENFELQEEDFSGIKSRIIQHEYDHLEGILFIDHVSPLKRKLLQSKLNKITKGQIEVNYKIKVR